MDLGTKKNFKGPSKLVRQPLHIDGVTLLFRRSVVVVGQVEAAVVEREFHHVVQFHLPLVPLVFDLGDEGPRKSLGNITAYRLGNDGLGNGMQPAFDFLHFAVP